jgi:hypothetical protein
MVRQDDVALFHPLLRPAGGLLQRSGKNVQEYVKSGRNTLFLTIDAPLCRSSRRPG